MSSRLFDLLERTGWTAVQAFLAVWIATESDLWSETSLKVAGTAAVIAAAKCLIAFQVGSSNTAATLPVKEDTELGGDHGAIGADQVITIALGILLAVAVVLLVRMLA